MPRPATGHVEQHVHKDGTVSYRLRIRAYGQRHRITVGTDREGWNEHRAQAEADRIMAQVQRGTWQPPPPRRTRRRQPARAARTGETVQHTVSRWWAGKQAELAENTRLDYRRRISHILAHLADETTASLDAQRVDAFRLALQRQGFAPRYVNMILGLLATVLDDAVDYGLLTVNPARGRRRRVKVPKPARSFLEPDMVHDLLKAAGDWEETLRPHQRYGRRAFIATLILAGPRISELIETDRGQLDLHAGVLRLGKKTAAGRGRVLELSFFLQAELRAHIAAMNTLGRPLKAGMPLFPTTSGGRLNASNIRNRALSGAVDRANTKRAREGKLELPHVTPHSMRRTFCSLAFAAQAPGTRGPARSVEWCMGQLGHDDPRMTLSVYRQVLARRNLDRALIWEMVRAPDEPEWPGAQVDFSGQESAPARRSPSGA